MLEKFSLMVPPFLYNYSEVSEGLIIMFLSVSLQFLKYNLFHQTIFDKWNRRLFSGLFFFLLYFFTSKIMPFARPILERQFLTWGPLIWTEPGFRCFGRSFCFSVWVWIDIPASIQINKLVGSCVRSILFILHNNSN